MTNISSTTVSSVNVSSLAAYRTYKLFNAAGDACLASAVHDFAWERKTRSGTHPMMAAALFSKVVSLIAFHSHSAVAQTQPHPFSGISYPGFVGLVNANFAYLLGGATSEAKAVGRFASFIGEGALDFANITHVYETPSSFMSANSFITADNHTLKKNYQNTEGSTLALVGTIAMYTVPFFDILRLTKHPIIKQSVAKTKTHWLAQRVLVVVQNVLCLAPTITHLILLKSNINYRYAYLDTHQLMLQNAPYLTSILTLAFFKWLSSRKLWSPLDMR